MQLHTCQCLTDLHLYCAIYSFFFLTLPGQVITVIVVLQILDASNFSKGPVAKLWLKHHVPHGLHGFFSPKYFGPES